MSGKTGKQLKGDFGLFTLSLILVLMVAIMLGAAVYIKENTQKIKLNIEVSVKADDRGSWGLSFLKSAEKGKTYAETIGSSLAVNKDLFIKDSKEEMEKAITQAVRLDSINKAVSLSSGLTLGIIKQQSEISFFNIAVPGGQMMKMEIREGGI